MESKIKLVEVNYDNFEDLIDLKVKDSQKNFVASNIYSIAQAYAAVASKGNVLPFGIYLEDKPIGFIMFGYYPDIEYARWVFEEDEVPYFIPESYLVWRFMIDENYQGKGYGREAFRLALEYVRSFPIGEAKYCWLSYEPENGNGCVKLWCVVGNSKARKLYESLGFEETGRADYAKKKY